MLWRSSKPQAPCVGSTCTAIQRTCQEVLDIPIRVRKCLIYQSESGSAWYTNQSQEVLDIPIRVYGLHVLNTYGGYMARLIKEVHHHLFCNTGITWIPQVGHHLRWPIQLIAAVFRIILKDLHFLANYMCPNVTSWFLHQNIHPYLSTAPQRHKNVRDPTGAMFWDTEMIMKNSVHTSWWNAQCIMYLLMCYSGIFLHQQFHTDHFFFFPITAMVVVFCVCCPNQNSLYHSVTVDFVWDFCQKTYCSSWKAFLIRLAAKKLDSHKKSLHDWKDPW